MVLRRGIGWTAMASCLIVSCCAIPSSLVEEIKASEMRGNKVKRAHPQPEENGREVPYFTKPTAIKRGTTTNLKTPPGDALDDWEAAAGQYRLEEGADPLAGIRSSLFDGSAPFDDKSVAEYEKGFRYGSGKEQLDEALANAVLKSEPAFLNQYRYYHAGGGEGEERRRRRRRRDARRNRLETRIKRDVDLTPEEILTILSLYENERQNPYRPWSYEPEQEQPEDGPSEEDNWMDAPVYPHATGHNDIASGYLYDEKPFENRARWADSRKKRFMVAKKRNDPTRELRYLNGPNKNDYYTLSQLLSNQREPNVPLYHRLVL